MRLRRLLVPITAATLGLATLATPAVAAEGDFVANATGEGFAVTLPMSPVGEVLGGSSRASVSHAPAATASAVGLALVEESQTEASVTAAGSADDPRSCGTAGLPAELASVIAAACSESHAAIADGLPTAAAEASGLELDLDGGDIAVILDTILARIDDAALGTAIAEVETQVLSPVRTALAEACLAGSEALGPVYDGAGELIAEVERNLGENLPIDVSTLDPSDPCVVLLDLTANPPVIGSPADVLDTLRERLAAALSEATVLAATLGSSESTSTTTAPTVTTTASATGVGVALPALDLAGTLVDTLTGVVDGFLGEVAGRLVDVEVEPVLPGIDDLVDELVAALPAEVTDLLGDTEPLLTITGGASDASVTLDRADGVAVPSGRQAPVVVTLSAAFEAFLETLLAGGDVPGEVTVPEGDRVTIAEGTPLESTIAVGSVMVEEVELDGLAGQRATAAGVDIVLLKGLEGGIGLAVAGAVAEAAGDAAPSVPTVAPPLPTTGGGLALLGLLGMGLAWSIRRP